MKKTLVAKSILGASLALAACERVPADGNINHNIAARDRLGGAANLLLQEMDLVHPASGVVVNMTNTPQKSPFKKDNAPWVKQTGTVKSPYGSCTVTAIGRENPDGTFGGSLFNGYIHVPTVTELAVASPEGSVDIEVGDPAADYGGDPSLTVNGTTYRATPGSGESQLTDSAIDSARVLAESELKLCGAIPGYGATSPSPK